jgi:vacuolar protein-sorting-associated protein 4
VEIVTQAITADNEGDYEKALAMYRKSLDYFMTGLKYEKNPAARDRVMEKVEGYMQRAEFLKNAITDQKSGKPGGGGGGAATASRSEEGKSKEDDETNKMRGALSSAIVSEKPNVKWSDVAGLEMAKDALKEAVILPIRFPQFFTGKRKPWKGILLYGPVRADNSDCR